MKYNSAYTLSGKITSLLLAIVLTASMGCRRVLDKRDLAAIPEDLVWSDLNLATAFLNETYVRALPAWSDPLNHASEEGSGGTGMYGNLTIESVTVWPYVNIRNLNTILLNVPNAPFNPNEKNNLRGQALFLRAWEYFKMVRLYGGVPLVLTPQQLGPDLQPSEDLKVPRNKTSECIAQIIKDLDSAALLLPAKWASSVDDGRITRGAALAFKGRVLLHYASEQFNPAQQAGRWQEAYTSNKAAVDSLTKFGYDLMPDFGGLWFIEGSSNKEAVLVTRFNNPGRTHTRDASVRPLSEAQNFSGGDQPTLNLVQAFPMKNGKSITDPASGYNANAYWQNRDPRFYTTIAYNGVLWPLSGQSGRIQWNFNGAYSQGGTGTGFYTKKGINEAYKPLDTERSGTDWIEIRFAEVLLNYAEAANETGMTNAAYEVLKRIRQRAGIEAGGDGLYGLPAAMNQSQMRDAILNERLLELAFEGKREQDLRRRKLYATVLNGKPRNGLVIRLIANGGSPQAFYAAYAAGSVNLNTNYYTYFSETINNIDGANAINFRDNYYFYAIPTALLQRNPALKQTNGWDGGSFDPLQ